MSLPQTPYPFGQWLESHQRVAVELADEALLQHYRRMLTAAVTGWLIVRAWSLDTTRLPSLEHQLLESGKLP